MKLMGIGVADDYIVGVIVTSRDQIGYLSDVLKLTYPITEILKVLNTWEVIKISTSRFESIARLVARFKPDTLWVRNIPDEKIAEIIDGHLAMELIVENSVLMESTNFGWTLTRTANILAQHVSGRGGEGLSLPPDKLINHE